LARDDFSEFSILVIASGEQYIVPVRTPVVTVGRWREADICLPDRLVSRTHAVLRFEEGIVTVEDLGSVNGTRIRDWLIDLNEETRVHLGDVICIGASVLLVKRSRVDKLAARERSA
jgi:pSer/pThr/pTyr-binding forkhead associated (FHA) protein